MFQIDQINFNKLKLHLLLGIVYKKNIRISGLTLQPYECNIFTILLLNWLSKKCAATCAGSRLCNIRLLDSCRTSISFFSWDACNCQRKSNRAVHSTKRPWTRIAIINIIILANEIRCKGIEELWKEYFVKN